MVGWAEMHGLEVLVHQLKSFDMDYQEQYILLSNGGIAFNLACKISQTCRSLACAYAWSHSRISYFLTTTGNTNLSKQTYITQFEDEFGCVNFKDIPHPVLADMLYNFLLLIDEHNKQRQNILNLEKSSPTRNVWFRLLTTVVEMSVVDFH